MPREWYDRGANKIDGNGDGDEIGDIMRNLEIVADKKPYFMIYIYPELMRLYNTYKSNTNKKCLREFRITIDELLVKKYSDMSEEEREFVMYYFRRMPVGINECIMNKICKRFEEEFDGYIQAKCSNTEFDYEIMKSDSEYCIRQYNTVLQIFEEYNRRLQDYMQNARRNRVNKDESRRGRLLMVQEFKTRCERVCSDEKQLCDIVLDICYKQEGSKQFAWDVCGDVIVKNLLNRNNNLLWFPVIDEDGDITFRGKSFSIISKEVDE